VNDENTGDKEDSSVAGPTLLPANSVCLDDKNWPNISLKPIEPEIDRANRTAAN